MFLNNWIIGLRLIENIQVKLLIQIKKKKWNENEIAKLILQIFQISNEN